jgi:hypothetical protein
MKAMLRKEFGEHKTLRIAVEMVLNDFEMSSEGGTSSLVVQVVNVTDRARRMAKRTLHLGIQRHSRSCVPITRTLTCRR